MAIDKEMKKAIPAFDKQGDITCEDARNGKALIGYQEIESYVVFDMKMDGPFTRKARFQFVSGVLVDILDTGTD